MLLLVFIYPGKRSQKSREKIPDVFYSHRGLWDKDKPENSILSFSHAVECGYGIELDLQLTKDSQVVVFHDDNVKRMCGVDKNICDMTLNEVKDLLLLETGEKIPLFSEVLELVGGKVPLIIELKCATAAAVLPLCEKAFSILDSYEGVYCIESFNPLALLWCKKNRLVIIRGQLADAFLRKPETRSLMYFVLHNMLFNILTKPDFIAYNTQNKNALAFRLVKIFRPTTIGWTIRSQEEINHKHFDRFIFERFVPIIQLSDKSQKISQ